MKEEFVNWYIKGVHKESKLFNDYCKSKNYRDYNFAFESCYIYYIDGEEVKYSSIYKIPEGYTEITIEQFKDYVFSKPCILNEDDMTYLEEFLLKLNIK